MAFEVLVWRRELLILKFGRMRVEKGDNWANEAVEFLVVWLVFMRKIT